MPEWSAAVQMTVLEPTGKVEPETGELLVMRFGSQSVRTGPGNATAAKPESGGDSAAMMVLGQIISGAVVSMVVTVWLQVALLPQGSVALQARVALKLPPTSGFVTVPITLMVTLVPLQLSMAVGESKLHALPHWTVLLVAQVMTGVVVSTTVMV